jgi:hypothetical protein
LKKTSAFVFVYIKFCFYFAVATFTVLVAASNNNNNNNLGVTINFPDSGNGGHIVSTHGNRCSQRSPICATDLRSGGLQNFQSKCHMTEENGRGGRKYLLK